MVGKWYKYIGPTDKYFTTDKWYLCYELGEKGNLHFIDNDNDIDELNWFFSEKLNGNIDLSNPMDYNPDELRVEKDYYFVGSLLDDPIYAIFTKGKKYSIRQILDTYRVINDLGQVVILKNLNFFIEDLSHLLKDYKLEEKKEEPKPEKRCDTITIELLPDNKLTLHTTIETLRKFLALVDNEKA